jgi:uncharacterized membrane protein
MIRWAAFLLSLLLFCFSTACAVLCEQPEFRQVYFYLSTMWFISALSDAVVIILRAADADRATRHS